ncbi:MAG: phosphatidylserine decarboxylase [Victivallaceae bacterium]|nr:phosphatidylserine decarboxylase [Victivallaceae bacterium]
MMTLTRFGFREWGLAILAAAVIWTVCYFMIRYDFLMTFGIVLASATLVVLVAFCAFFRSPHRMVPQEGDLVVSPADGTIRDITVLERCDEIPVFGDTKVVRIGIFLSVLNVHVNRTPVRMQVLSKNYRPGEFLDARNPEAGTRNEAMTISGTGYAFCGGDIANTVEFPVAVRQISGAIARRIVCPVDTGSSFDKGVIYGMIKFGSRTELYLPESMFDVRVKIGDKVRGGSTVMAVLRESVGNGDAK